jgi:signal transduction histidine kinase
MPDIVRALVAASPDAMLVSNSMGRVVLANPAAAALTGFEIEELIGSSLAEFVGAELTTAVQRVTSSDGLIVDNTSVVDGALHHRVDGPRRVDVHVTRLDLNDHPLAAVYLRPGTRDAGSDELHTFRHLLDAVIGDQALPELLDVAARGACELFGADGASVARHDPDTDSIEVIAACGELGKYLGVRVLLPGTRVEVALRQGTPVHFVEGGVLNQRWQIDQGPAFGELWIAPLTLDGEPFGVLSVASQPGHSLAAETGEKLASFVDIVNLSLEITEANRHRSALAVVADHERIARDLHDVVIQRLIASAMRLESLSHQIDPEVRCRVNKVIDDLDRVTRDIRATVFHLQRDDDHSDVGRDIEELTASTGEAFGLDTDCSVTQGSEGDVPEGLRAHLLAVTREALSNVGRHAQASRVSVEVSLGDPLRLTITDDGEGVTEDCAPGNGLRNLAARAEELGGSLTLHPGHPTGTVLLWEVPWPIAAGGEPGSATDL